MQSSTWRALGNTYLVVEPGGTPLDESRARELFGATDGIVEVVSVEGNRLAVRIWNPDGSLAELSGNGTRIAAAWHEARSGAREVSVAVGDRVTHARVLGDGRIEQQLGDVVVGPAEIVAGVTVIPVSVGNPMPSSSAIRATSPSSGRCSRRTGASRTARTCRSSTSRARAR